MSPREWQEADAWLSQRLERARRVLETPADPIQTAALRGEIRALRAMQAWAEEGFPPPPIGVAIAPDFLTGTNYE